MASPVLPNVVSLSSTYTRRARSEFEISEGDEKKASQSNKPPNENPPAPPQRPRAQRTVHTHQIKQRSPRRERRVNIQAFDDVLRIRVARIEMRNILPRELERLCAPDAGDPVRCTEHGPGEIFSVDRVVAIVWVPSVSTAVSVPVRVFWGSWSGFSRGE